jgi:hypothetical protein
MKKILLMTLVLTTSVFAESVNDLNGTFPDKEFSHSTLSIIESENLTSVSDTFIAHETQSRALARRIERHEEKQIAVTEITGTFEE